MSDVMLLGVLRMPYAMAMSSELSQRQFYERAQEAANRLEGLNAAEWMPIETAPQDGTRIMLGNKHATWEAEYRPVYQSGYRPDNPWESMMLNMDHLPRENRYGPPTHWMPLPPPPTDRRTPEQPE